jgi:hypothetical protein
MLLSRLINLSAVLISFWGSIYLSMGILVSSPSSLAELCTSKWDFNQDMIISLSTQKAQMLTGVFLIAFSFLIILSINLGLDNFNWYQKVKLGLGYSAGLIFLLIGLLFITTTFASKLVYNKTEFGIKRVIAINRIINIKENYSPTTNVGNIKGIKTYARDLFGILKSDEEDDFKFLENYFRHIKLDFDTSTKLLEKLRQPYSEQAERL